MVGAKITTKGQVTIPKRIREYLGLRPGSRVVFIEKDDEIVLQVLDKTLLDLRGFVEPKQKPEDFEKVRKHVKKQVARKHGKDS